MHAVIETREFLLTCAEAGVPAAERREIVRYFSENPRAGDVIKATGGARKVRIGGRGNKGKSGSYRVISYFAGDDVPVFLLILYGKGEQANLSQAERNALRAALAGLATDYRESVRRRARRGAGWPTRAR